MIENLVLVVGLIGIGTLINKWRVLPESTADVLNSFVLNISLPAMILISIPKLVLSEAVLYPIVSHWVLYGINITLVVLVCKILNFSKSVLGVLLVVSCLGNTAFLGIPMVSTFFGSSAVPYAVLYDQLGSGLAFILTGAFILPLFTGQESKSISDVLKNLIKFPPFVALVLGFALMFFPAPYLINNLLDKIAQTLVPCAMIAVGFQMKYKLAKDKLLPIVMALIIKLMIIPIIGLIFVYTTNIRHGALDVSILQSGMPPMITAGAMAMHANLERDISASIVGYGLLISFITLPAIKYFL